MSENATLSPLSESLKQVRERIAARDFNAALAILMHARKDQYEGSSSEEKEEMSYCFGVAYNGVERPGDAIVHLSRSLQLAEHRQDIAGQARSHEELGGAHHQRGDYQQAHFCYDRALELYRRLEDKSGQARAHR